MADIKKRRYKLLSDFVKVYKYLEDIYDINTLNSCLLPTIF